MNFDIITFDCYGTLIDWNAGISSALQAAAREDGVEFSAEQILDVYHDVEPVLQQEGYRSYREVLAEAAAMCAERLAWPLSVERRGFLGESLVGWAPFADTNAALEALRRAGYQLGILSNIDDDLIAGTQQHFTVPFDLVITAEQVRSYKPSHGHFLTARERIGDGRWLHAAQSYYHDVVPARALDVPVVWVNRGRDEPQGHERPDGEVNSMADLVTWLEEQGE